MSKPLLFLLLSGAVCWMHPGPQQMGVEGDCELLIAQARSASRHITAPAPVAETTRIRNFTLPAESSSPSVQPEFSGESLTPYSDHAALPAGAVYTTSDEAA